MLVSSSQRTEKKLLSARIDPTDRHIVTPAASQDEAKGYNHRAPASSHLLEATYYLLRVQKQKELYVLYSSL
jgi:hypothetical protein